VTGFTHTAEVSVRFAETDAQGIAHHAAYLVWFEVARVEYLDRFAGGYPAIRAGGVEATTTEVRVRYLEPARFADRLRIHTRCRDVRGARFSYEYEVERDGVTIAAGETRHACVDAATMRPTRVPGWLAEAIARAESPAEAAAARSAAAEQAAAGS
jgi:acyl-CoA thioester hydrolase